MKILIEIETNNIHTAAYFAERAARSMQGGTLSDRESDDTGSMFYTVAGLEPPTSPVQRGWLIHLYPDGDQAGWAAYAPGTPDNNGRIGFGQSKVAALKEHLENVAARPIPGAENRGS